MGFGIGVSKNHNFADSNSQNIKMNAVYTFPFAIAIPSFHLHILVIRWVLNEKTMAITAYWDRNGRVRGAIGISCVYI